MALDGEFVVAVAVGHGVAAAQVQLGRTGVREAAGGAFVADPGEEGDESAQRSLVPAEPADLGTDVAVHAGQLQRVLAQHPAGGVGGGTGGRRQAELLSFDAAGQRGVGAGVHAGDDAQQLLAAAGPDVGLADGPAAALAGVRQRRGDVVLMPGRSAPNSRAGCQGTVKDDLPGVRGVSATGRTPRTRCSLRGAGIETGARTFGSGVFAMLDLAFVALVVAFFAIAALVARGVEKL